MFPQAEAINLISTTTPAAMAEPTMQAATPWEQVVPEATQAVAAPEATQVLLVSALPVQSRYQPAAQSLRQAEAQASGIRLPWAQAEPVQFKAVQLAQLV
jgi:hypothetical protein